jgi:hypothetical protein
MKFNYTITENNIKLAFLNSTDIYMYPCSRRSSEPLAPQQSSFISQQYIPFDPEARLNTEANNMKLSSTNGFAQNYIRSWWTSTTPFTKVLENVPGASDVNNSIFPGLFLNLGGYSFYIPDTDTVDNFGRAVIRDLGLTGTQNFDIYANIRLEKTPLYQEVDEEDEDEGVNVNTWVLRNQTATSVRGTACLDLLVGDQTANQPDYASSFFFSGLSFSVRPLAGDFSSQNNKNKESYKSTIYHVQGGFDQQVISLHIMHYSDSNNTWEIFQPALLPHIWHDPEEDSVAVEYFRVHEKAEVGDDINLLGNVVANQPNKRAYFNDLRVDSNLGVAGNTQLTGNLLVNNTNNTTIAQFDNVKTINLSATSAQIGSLKADNISASGINIGSENRGVLTYKIVNSPNTNPQNVSNRVTENRYRNTRAPKRLTFTSYKAGSVNTVNIGNASTVNIANYGNFTLKN